MRKYIYFSIIIAAPVIITAAILIPKLLPPPEVRAAISELRSSEPHIRWEAADRLAAMGPQAKGAEESLIEALRDPEPNGLVTVSATKALVAIGADQNRLIPVLTDVVRNGKGNAPVWAVRALLDLGPAGVSALSDLVRRHNATEDITHGLASFGQDAIQILTDLAKADDESLRSVAVEALGRIRWQGIFPQQLSMLEAALVDKSANVRMVAMEKLGELGAAASHAKPLLLTATKDPHPYVRLAAANALARVDPASIGAAIDVVAQELNSTDDELRNDAFDVLPSYGQPVVARLLQVLNSKDDATRISAIVAIESIGRGAFDAVPELVKLLDDPNTDVRNEALRALDSIGPAAPAAVPELINLLNSTDDSLRFSAASALERIGQPARWVRFLPWCNCWTGDPTNRSAARF